MPARDPLELAREVTRTETLLRDARAVPRELDIPAVQAMPTQDPALPDIASPPRQLRAPVSLLVRRVQAEPRRVRDAVRRLR